VGDALGAGDLDGDGDGDTDGELGTTICTDPDGTGTADPAVVPPPLPWEPPEPGPPGWFA
jgi:hypothetical protein